MRYVWIALATVLGFAATFFLALVAGLTGTVEAECDGPCFSKWDEVLYISVGIGVLGAVLSGYLTHRLTSKRFANRNAKPS